MGLSNWIDGVRAKKEAQKDAQIEALKDALGKEGIRFDEVSRWPGGKIVRITASGKTPPKPGGMSRDEARQNWGKFEQFIQARGIHHAQRRVSGSNDDDLAGSDTVPGDTQRASPGETEYSIEIPIGKVGRLTARSPQR